MSALATLDGARLDALAAMRDFEKTLRESFPAAEVFTQHSLHAGVYTRAARVKAGVVFTSVLIKIPTTVIVVGECYYTDLENASTQHFSGVTFMDAKAPRKSAYATVSDVDVIMYFRTDAKTVKEAEAEFTDEVDQLVSRRQGVESCPV